MSRALFEQVTDVLRGFLPPALRDFHLQTGARNCRVWFEEPAEHYEVQTISRSVLSRAGFKGTGPALEVGFHAEHARASHNEQLLTRLAQRERTWRKTIGREAVAGPFIGRAEHAAKWRRISELWEDTTMISEEEAIEAAERLATYIGALEPVRR